jgi:hypothetical protein
MQMAVNPDWRRLKCLSSGYHIIKSRNLKQGSQEVVFVVLQSEETVINKDRMIIPCKFGRRGEEEIEKIIWKYI